MKAKSTLLVSTFLALCDTAIAKPGDAEMPVVIPIVAIGFGLFIFLFVAAMVLSPPRRPAPKTVDELNADALLLAAKRHHTEMMTELRKAEIEAARVEAIHKERDEIIAHDRKVRELNAHLDERRGRHG
jgi:hypothetical protein